MDTDEWMSTGFPAYYGEKPLSLTGAVERRIFLHQCLRRMKRGDFLYVNFGDFIVVKYGGIFKIKEGC
jgi:hypothetical protein